MKIAPIVLFVYNRPEHTFKTVEALKKNHLAADSLLYVYADGPKINSSEEDIENIAKVRGLVDHIDGFKDVVVRKSDNNKGLAESIVSGVTEVVNEHDRVIVLEDDIITSSGFLKYMNDALDIYEKEEKVMHVSGYMFPVKKRLPSTFFYNTASCWGWGTWKRAWKMYEDDAHYLMKEIASKDLIGNFNVENSYNFFGQLEANAYGRKKTWAVKWYASFFLKNGFALHPYPSLTNNIGHDSSGTNSKSSSTIYQWKKLPNRVEVAKIPIIESKTAHEEMVEFHNRNKSKTTPIIKLKQFVFNKLTKNKAAGFEFKEIHKLPRFKPGFVQLAGKPVKFVDKSSFLFMYREIFESQIYKFHCKNKFPNIIDAGANIGLSILFFKTLFPQAKIVAFEPDKEVFKVLKENCIKNWGFGDVQLHNYALWKNEDAKLKFWHEGADGNRISKESAKRDDCYDVRTTILSKYIDEEVDFLKIDIEGAECEVLEESKDLLSNVNNLFLEYHSFANRRQKLHRLLEIVTAAGFRYNIQSIGVKSPNPFIHIMEYYGMDLQLNIFCVRR